MTVASQIFARDHHLVRQPSLSVARFVSLARKHNIAKGRVATTKCMHMEIDGPGISSLPLEILTKIFLDCVPDATTFQTPQRWKDQTHPRNAPILLTCVSRYWREVAFNTPLLWSSLSLSNAGNSKIANAYLSALKTWLSLSQSLPLRIKLNTSDPLTVKIAYLQLLCGEAERWNEVSLESFHPMHFQISHLSPFPTLTALSLKFDDADLGHPQFPVFLDGLKSAPNLRRAEITFPSLAGLPLPWSTLTEYAFRCSRHIVPVLDIPLFATEMGQCSNLAKALFEIEEGYHGFRIISPIGCGVKHDCRRATLPRLLHLTISTDVTEVFEALFDSLRAPSLEHITIRSTDPYGSSWGHSNHLALKEFLSPCAFSLTSIRVEIPANMIPEGLLIDLLRDLPSLLTMYFIGPHDYLYWSRVLDALAIRSDQGTNLRLRDFGVFIDSVPGHRDPRRHLRRPLHDVPNSSSGHTHDPSDRRLFFDSLKAMVESRLPPVNFLDARSASASYTSAGEYLETLTVSPQISSDAELSQEGSASILRLWSARSLRVEVVSSAVTS